MPVQPAPRAPHHAVTAAISSPPPSSSSRAAIPVGIRALALTPAPRLSRPRS